MRTARSARRTCSAFSSAVEYTATASTPSSCSARITRTAISPRFATSTRENIGLERVQRRRLDRLEFEQELAVLDRLGVLDVNRAHDALRLGLELVHELHRLEDAERLTGRDGVADLHEGVGSWLRRPVEGADHRRLDPDHAVGLGHA